MGLIMQDGYLDISNDENSWISEGGSLCDEIPDVISPDWDI
jgi:hypothetical protein